MHTRTVGTTTLVLVLLAFVGSALAGPPDPATSSINVTFSQTYLPSNCLFPGQPYDYVTVAPDGMGETFADMGITIEVILRDALGLPCVGIGAADVVLFNARLLICPGGNIADAPTDATGRTTFSGTLAAGGCTEGTGLDVFVSGVFFGNIPVNTNSPDFAHQLTSPGFVDASDLANFAAVFGQRCAVVGPTFICYDFNERDPTIDASDLAFFASKFRAQC